MKPLAIVFPMFWGREKKDIFHPGDHFYDHPTALDDEGTIPPLFQSLGLLQDRDFEIIAVAGASHPSIEDDVERAAQRLLDKYADQSGVRLHFFSHSHLQRIHGFLRERGEDRLLDAVSLVGYSPLRNACLVGAHLLGMEIAVSIDDDCVFVDPDYLGRIRRLVSSEFEGRPVLACCGPYLTAKDSIYLDLPAHPHSAYWNVIEAMNAAFKRYIVDAPGLQDVPFAIMGNIAVHREFFTRCPLDPPMRRGEDMDWVMNAHILGERFVMDPGLVIKHLPPPRPHPTWRPMREDIHRFLYQRAKIDHSRDGDGYHHLERARYVPYPGAFFQDDFPERAARASLVLATDYLAQGQIEDATEALANILHAYRLGRPEGDPFQRYLDFQAKWVRLMQLVEEHRQELRSRVFG